MPNLTARTKAALLRVAHALQAPAVANLKDQNAQLRDDLAGERMLCDLQILRCRRLTQQLDDLKQQLASARQATRNLTNNRRHTMINGPYRELTAAVGGIDPEYPLIWGDVASRCPSRRFVGGTSRWVCECDSPTTCPGVNVAAERYNAAIAAQQAHPLTTPADTSTTD